MNAREKRAALAAQHKSAKPSPAWRVNADGDLEMQGEAIVDAAAFSPSSGNYFEACANIRLAAAAPMMLAALEQILVMSRARGCLTATEHRELGELAQRAIDAARKAAQ